MRDTFKALFEDEDWSWNDLADAIIEEFGWSESTEVISCMLCFGEHKDEITDEVASWRNIEEMVKRRLLRRLLEEDKK